MVAREAEAGSSLLQPPSKRLKGVTIPSKFCAVFMGSSDGSDPEYRAAASRLGSLLAERGVGLVYGGAKGGLMGAVADGVLQHASGYAVGVFPPGNVVPTEMRHAGLSEAINTNSMPERKQIMMDRADVVVALPGGPGTLDELSEVMMHKRLGHHRKPIFALNVNGFWDPLVELLTNMERGKFMSEDSAGTLLSIVDTPEELVASGRFLRTDSTIAKSAAFIDKLALIVVQDRKQMVARSHGKDAFFTPGGKREAGESDEEALVREIKEELNVDVVKSSIKPYGVFQAQAFGKPEGTMVRMTCYEAEYAGTPTPTNEVAELRMITSEDRKLLTVTGVMILEDLKAKGLID